MARLAHAGFYLTQPTRNTAAAPRIGGTCKCSKARFGGLEEREGGKREIERERGEGGTTVPGRLEEGWEGWRIIINASATTGYARQKFDQRLEELKQVKPRQAHAEPTH